MRYVKVKGIDPQTRDTFEGIAAAVLLSLFIWGLLYFVLSLEVLT